MANEEFEIVASDDTNEKFGVVTTDSTSTTVNLLIINKEELNHIVGKQAQIELVVLGKLYKAIGLLTDVKTVNEQLTRDSFAAIAARGSQMKVGGVDLRKGSFKIQAVFQRDEENNIWMQAGAALPTSPSTGAPVMLLDENSISEFIVGDLPAVGFMRGMPTTAARMSLTDFSGSGGASHSAILGRSGSGKSQLYALSLAAYMKYESHAIVVVDPQGQWSNENGMIFSPQKFAKALGRQVSVLRVSEDIRLPLDEEVISSILDRLDVWRKGFRRMATENRELLSDVVVSKLIRRTFKNPGFLNKDPREILTKIFSEIAKSSSSLGRIYANGGETQYLLKRELYLLSGEQEPPRRDEDSEELIEPFDEEEIESAEESWDSLLQYFSPLLNLFSSTNLSGGERKALGGEKGFLSTIFQARTKDSSPAPYVVLDMSPSVQLHAKQSLLGGRDSEAAMRKMLDNQDVKALILRTVFVEVKKASELAFEAGGKTLNTQIVFDEAWRYAPETSKSKEISLLADMLEGFALDTRKFGIGWSYILQTPSDLRQGIWKQLTYVYSGYGLVGEDLRRLEGLMDDPKMLDFYRQFIPPASSGQYPFMITGPVSPLIFTNAPTFINAFAGDQFLEHNQDWITEITKRRGLPTITNEYLQMQNVPGKMAIASSKKKKNETKPVASYKIGKADSNSGAGAVQPQTKVSKPVVKKALDENDFPF